jgi:hypothetical protein
MDATNRRVIQGVCPLWSGYLVIGGIALHAEGIGEELRQRFGLEQSQLQTPDRLSRLLLVMRLALYFAVSTGHWDAVANPTVDEKSAPPTAWKPEPRPVIMVHQNAPAHRQDGHVRVAATTALGIRMKLMGAQVSHRLTIFDIDLAKEVAAV